ncbi:MAG: SDR family oxidoreductase [Bradyrhizobiaceae bacterium]|nr:SDR family oxidoreductase [Bradyrhizobiaceae bacterium]
MDNPIVIVGAGSTTAAALVPMLAQEVSVPIILLTSGTVVQTVPGTIVRTVDVTDKSQLKAAILQDLPGTIINLAAHTNVDGCETDKVLAWKLNTTLVENLVRLARTADSHLIQLSTDYVFDGERGPYTEADVPSPINYYGKSKLAGENIIASSGIDASIIRTNVVYGPLPSRPDFVHWILHNYEQGLPSRVASDQYSNPTYVDDLAEVILHLVHSRRTGTYHVGGADYVSRYEFAQRIAKVFKLDEDMLQPVPTSELQQTARRPLRAGLVSLKAESEFRIRLRGIDSGLVSYRHTLFANQ